MSYRFLSLMYFLFFTAIFSCSARGLQKEKLFITRPDGTVIGIEAEIARSAKEQSFGYMERKNIPLGTGMLFVFDKDQILSFWMKNTPTPLSIAYVDSSGTIREIFDMEAFSLSNVSSTMLVRYALEVPQGWFRKNNIILGSKISLPK